MSGLTACLLPSHCCTRYALYPYLVEALPTDALAAELLLEKAVIHALDRQLCPPGLQVGLLRNSQQNQVAMLCGMLM